MREVGHNRGEVEKYLRSTGLPNGSPYCASGIYWSFDTACFVLNLDRRAIPIPRTGLANAIYEHARKRKNAERCSSTPQPGDLLVWRIQNTIFGHIGQVVSNYKTGWLKTIEYNTSAQNARDGDGVCYKLRNTKHPLGRMKFRGFVTFRR